MVVKRHLEHLEIQDMEDSNLFVGPEVPEVRQYKWVPVEEVVMDGTDAEEEVQVMVLLFLKQVMVVTD